MAIPSTFPTGWDAVGPDSSLTVRRWVALFLRIGIGLSLLSSGLSGYFGTRGPGGGRTPIGPIFSFQGLDPFFTALPYLAIALGLALILGFLTTVSAIASAFFSLLMPMFHIVQIISGGVAGGINPGSGRWGNDPFLTMTVLSNMLPMAAMIWLSPLENHPYSIDALIFGRNAIEIPPPAVPDPAPATGSATDTETDEPMRISE